MSATPCAFYHRKAVKIDVSGIYRQKLNTKSVKKGRVSKQRNENVVAQRKEKATELCKLGVRTGSQLPQSWTGEAVAAGP